MLLIKVKTINDSVNKKPSEKSLLTTAYFDEKEGSSDKKTDMMKNIQTPAYSFTIVIY
jgi:hypothetical protein